MQRLYEFIKKDPEAQTQSRNHASQFGRQNGNRHPDSLHMFLETLVSLPQFPWTSRLCISPKVIIAISVKESNTELLGDAVAAVWIATASRALMVTVKLPELTVYL
jgi:hypothetical protein